MPKLSNAKENRLETISRMESALTEMRDSLERDDYKDCIDWGLTLRHLQAELEMTIMTRLTNR